MRVLVAEGCRSLADLVAESLTGQGMAVDVAYDGPEAASKLRINRYDVTVLDRWLTGIPGDTLCRMVVEPEPRVMTLLLGGGSPAERVSGLALGADDYLAKPFHLPELVLRVGALARRRPRAFPVVLRAGGVELDSLARSARRDGRTLNLSPKELAVLEALLAASPAYLSAEELLERVWDENADPFTKTVTVTVGRLRRKLGAPRLIETAVGLGYRVFCPQDYPGGHPNRDHALAPCQSPETAPRLLERLSKGAPERERRWGQAAV